MDTKTLKTVKNSISLLLSAMVLFFPLFNSPLSGNFSLFDELMSAFNFVGKIPNMDTSSEFASLMIFGIIYCAIIFVVSCSAVWALVASLFKLLSGLQVAKIPNLKGSATSSGYSLFIYWLVAKFFFPMLVASALGVSSDAGEIGKFIAPIISEFFGFKMNAMTELAMFGYVAIVLLIANTVLFFMVPEDKKEK